MIANPGRIRGLFFVFIIVNFISVRAQPDPRVDSVAQLIRKYFNEKSAEKLYRLTAAGFQKAMPAERFALIGKNNLFPLGEMPRPQFIGTANGTAKYKVDFAAASLGMYLSLDSSNKLQGFLFKPYADEAQKKTAVATSNPLATTLDKQVEAAVHPYANLASTASLSIGVLKNGGVRYYHYGEKEKGKAGLPDEHSLYEIGSITKTFTALLLADAVVNGEMKLDDPVNRYLPPAVPKLQFEGTPVTLKMLANHTAGLPRMPGNFETAVKDAADPYKFYGEAELTAFYIKFKLAKKPGTAYEYSNLGAATLGWILERFYKKNFETLVKEKIALACGLKETMQTVAAKDSGRFLNGYTEEGKPASPWSFSAFSGAGALRSTAADMMLYAQAVLNQSPPSLSKALALAETVTFTDGNNKIGLGWHYLRAGTGELLFHNGGTGGFRSFLAVNKQAKTAVVLLSNSAVSVDEAGKNLMEALEKEY